MKKSLALVLTILVTLIGTALVGIYDYNIYLNPEDKNGGTLTSKYKSYLSEKTLEINDDLSVQTESRISVFEYFDNEYYNSTPILKQDVKLGDKNVFTVAVYKNVIKYAPNADTSEWKYRYDVFVYNVDYEAIKEEFLSQPIPEDKTSIEKAGFPTLVINIYPNDSYDDSESFYYSATSVVNKIELSSGEIFSSKFNGYASLTMNDFNSKPQYKEDEESETKTPFNVNFKSIIGYPTNSENITLFDDSAYLKIEAISETSEVNYGLEEPLFKGKVEGFNFNDDINLDNYKEGCNTSSVVREKLNNVDIKGVMNYDAWIFARYIWWHCLIALVVIGLLSGGFFYALTVDTNTKKVVKPSNKKKKNKKK